MTTKKRMLYSRKELLDLKTKSLKKLQEGKLTKRQKVTLDIVTGKQIGRAHV